jgi:acetylserotonin N-methyltransferase
MSLPDPTPVLHLIEAFRQSKTMFAAVSLGVFDRLHEAPENAVALGAAIGADAGALERLLDGCAALGLLRKTAGVYANEPVAETYLCSASPHSMHGYIRYSDQALYAMWDHLTDAVREGTNRWEQTFGPQGGLFQHFFRTDAAMRDFLLGMHGFGMQSSPKVVAAFDLSRFRRLVDLGGATGHLAIAACERYPELHATVFDLPRVCEVAREQVASSEARDRITVEPGDFFADELPAADLYYAGRILHDWGEGRIGGLLRRIFERLPQGGAVLIGEKLLNDDGVGPLAANMQSINMLVCTEGRERTLGEYRQLLEAAGFRDVDGRRTGTALDAVIGLKL